MLYSLLKPALFSLAPETAHNLTLDVARLCPGLGRLTGVAPDPRLALAVGALRWTFPLGLAAGLDKNAEALDFFAGQGFGAVECGTVTLRPQAGNPLPRMFRYPAERSLRNAMGFPNHGATALRPRLRRYEGEAPLGVNLGKNKDTSPEESIGELSLLLETLVDVTDYFVVNVSSPNTPGLRALQEPGYLGELFAELNRHRAGKDLYLKIAPDLETAKVVELTSLVRAHRLTGVIATNTTIMPERGPGGVSGVLLREKARAVRRVVLGELGDREMIAVGGVTDPADLFDLWRDGGKAAQAYTAYVYQGPDLLKRFAAALARFCDEQRLNLADFFRLPLDERRYRLRD
jgi:dihydroorotate dehydrogenase